MIRIHLRRNLADARMLSLYAFNRYVRQIEVTGPAAFVMGCGHSGITLLLRVLGSHSRICGIPYESQLGFKLDQRQRLLKNFEEWTISEGKTRWVEKTPRHITCIQNLIEAFPDARMVIMLRNSRDVACSIKERKGSLELGIRRWVDDNRAGQEFWAHPNVRVLKYERLIEEFEPSVAEVLEFIGEEWEPAMREYHRQPKPVYYEKKIEKPDSPDREKPRAVPELAGESTAVRRQRQMD